MPHLCFKEGRDDCVSDFARADRSPRNRRVGRILSRSRTLTEIRSLARSHTRTAMNVLVGIMRSNDATPAARVSAANSILDRGWGKVAQPLQSGDDPRKVVHRIERVIVHPEDSPEQILDCEDGAPSAGD
jgi:hypothetical protein